MNKVLLIGRTTKDIELKQTTTGKSVCQFTLAVDKGYGQEGADFIDCQAWGKTAEFLSQYIKKGYLLSVFGRISTRTYKKDNRTIKITEIVCDEVKNLTPKKEPTPATSNQAPAPKYEQINSLDAPPLEYKEVAIDTDDLPFY